MVNVRVILSAFNIMRAALFCIRKTLSSNFLLQDDQVGLRYNIPDFITAADRKLIRDFAFRASKLKSLSMIKPSNL